MNNDLKEYYNKSYQVFTPDKLNSRAMESYLFENNASLINFIKNYFQSLGGLSTLEHKKILEIGCGHAGVSHFLSQYATNLWALDFSELAIMQARELAQQKSIPIQFIVSDITKDQIINEKFDLIIDSHLMHCLTDKKARESYYLFLKNHLSEDGIVLIETMCYNNQIFEPIDYTLSEDLVLFKTIDNMNLPIRKLIDSLELESEIKNTGLKIKTFFYHDELSFNVFPEIENYPNFRLPKTIRLSLTLK